MSEKFVDPILDAVERMREKRFGRAENVEIYAGNSVMDGIQDGRSLAVEAPDSFETARVYDFYGMQLTRDSRLDPYEVIILDRSCLTNGGDRLLLERPNGFEKLRLTNPKHRQTCEWCGSVEKVVVEGDGGEPYCSIECLNEAYNP